MKLKKNYKPSEPLITEKKSWVQKKHKLLRLKMTGKTRKKQSKYFSEKKP